MMVNFKSLSTRIVRSSKIALIFILILLFALAFVLTVEMASAHSNVNIDGLINPSGPNTEWCFPSFIPGGSDTRLTLTPAGGCPLGNEVVWDDGIGDGQSIISLLLPVDLQYFATTADLTAVYFALGFFSNGVDPEHFQIAIYTAPGGNNAWYSLGVIPLSAVGANATSGPLGPPLFPNYIITTDVIAAIATVWETNTGPPGTTPPLGTFQLGYTPGSPFPGPPGVVEIAIPWATFSLSPFGPGTNSFLTVMAAYDNSTLLCGGGPPGFPCNFDTENDLFSEPGPGAFTTTVDACPTGPGATACEILGTFPNPFSADAFIAVTYQGTTAVTLGEFNARAPQSILAPVALVSLIIGAGVTTIYLRRKKRPSL
jgi:hypothetical protein